MKQNNPLYIRPISNNKLAKKRKEKKEEIHGGKLVKDFLHPNPSSENIEKNNLPDDQSNFIPIRAYAPRNHHHHPSSSPCLPPLSNEIKRTSGIGRIDRIGFEKKESEARERGRGRVEGGRGEIARVTARPLYLRAGNREKWGAGNFQ